MNELDFPEGIEMKMFLDENGHVRRIEYRDGTVREVPLPAELDWPPPPATFRTGPMKNINLLKSEVFEILKWEELDDEGKVIKTNLSLHILCYPFLED